LRRSLENKNGNPFIIFLNDEQSKNSAEFYVVHYKNYFWFQKQNPTTGSDGVRNYFHLKRVMAKLQHMCLCECDHPLQIKTI
jgi:hypothetical protein